jgi:hypothetical protein
MDIAALIADPNTLITLPGPTIVKLIEERAEATSQRDTYKLTAESADGQVKTLNTQLRLATDRITELSRRVETLTAQLQEAAQPPVVPPAAPPSPLISKTEFSGVAGLTIEKSLKTPDDAMYAQVREVLTWAAGRGFNTWRGFFNADEVRQHLRLKDADPKHLPAFGRQHGLGFIADTVGTALKKLDSGGQREYLKGLEALGALAVVFNDANNEETLDLVEWTQCVRTVLPNMPIIASLTGTANITSYPMFDYLEAQTFGTRDELSRFLERAFNIFCLDARKGISATDLTVRAAIVLAANPKAFFYYADTTADWLNMPLDKQGTIRSMIAKWKALRP